MLLYTWHHRIESLTGQFFFLYAAIILLFYTLQRNSFSSILYFPKIKTIHHCMALLQSGINDNPTSEVCSPTVLVLLIIGKHDFRVVPNAISSKSIHWFSSWIIGTDKPTWPDQHMSTSCTSCKEHIQIVCHNAMHINDQKVAKPVLLMQTGEDPKPHPKTNMLKWWFLKIIL
jgi:hypothetical protein